MMLTPFVILLAAWRRFLDERGLVLSGSLAFTTMLALVPLATLVFGLVRRIAGVGDLVNRTRTYIFDSLVPGVSDVIEEQLDVFIANAASLPLIMLPVLGLSAILLLIEIEGAFVDIWRRQKLPSWRRRLLMVPGILLAMPLLAAVSGWAATSVLDKAAILVSPAIHHVISPAIGFVTFTLMYLIFPRPRPPVLAAAAGALFASILLYLTKQIFVFYVLTSPVQNIIYGALAAVPLLQLWLFILWVVVLVGGALVVELTERFPSR
jgi:membrane protein